jgi:hypothetical protein
MIEIKRLRFSSAQPRVAEPHRWALLGLVGQVMTHGVNCWHRRAIWTHYL